MNGISLGIRTQTILLDEIFVAYLSFVYIFMSTSSQKGVFNANKNHESNHLVNIQFSQLRKINGN